MNITVPTHPGPVDPSADLVPMLLAATATLVGFLLVLGLAAAIVHRSWIAATSVLVLGATAVGCAGLAASAGYGGPDPEHQAAVDRHDDAINSLPGRISTTYGLEGLTLDDEVCTGQVGAATGTEATWSDGIGTVVSILDTPAPEATGTCRIEVLGPTGTALEPAQG